MILFSYATSVAVAGLLSAAFLLVGRRLVPSLDIVDETTALAFMFVGATAIWCVFVLQDAVLTGLRRAVWVPAENGAFSLVKLALLVAFAAAFPRHGIFASWVIGAVVTILPVTILIVTRLAKKGEESTVEAPPTLRELTRYIAPDYVGAMGWLAAVTVVPLMITERAGAIENAYFTLAWVIVLPILSISGSMGSSLVVSGTVADRRLLPGYLRRMLTQTAMLSLPLVAFVEITAPQLLRIFGGDYSDRATTVLRLLALAAVPHIPIALAVSVARVQRRMRVVVGVQVAECAGILALTWALLGGHGVDGAGWAWLAAETVVAVAAALWLVSSLGVSDRFVPVVGRWRGVALGRWRERRLRPIVDEILELSESSDARLLATPASDTLVFASGDVVIKLAHTEAGCRSLNREIEVLRALASDTRLEQWLPVVPEVVSAGRASGHVYLVQDFVPGAEGRRLVDNPELFARAAEAIFGLHLATATERVIDGALLERWVERPLRRLEGFEVEPVRRKLHEGLAGRAVPVGWIHGDFVPANVIVDGYGVAAIVDWDQADRQGLPLVDLIQFALATRLLTDGGELGSLVPSFRLTPVEQAVVGELPIDLDVAVLLCWLRHVAANLEKSERYASSRPWLERNVKAVLDAH
jgi:O-antigen/teichoic acid export membrane protein